MTKRLSICMIVKDEEKNLRRCLDSLKPLLETDFVELIVVDTGSKDKTVEIAKEYTNRIYYHQWNNNFSDMRNISISYAKGNWILILDADEKISNINNLILLLEQKNLNQYNTVQFQINNILSMNEDIINTTTSERMFKNDGDFCYFGSVHNQPNLKRPILRSDIHIIHYGYINDDKDLMEKKFQRTATLLKEELKEDPKNIYYRFQLSRSFLMHGDTYEAYEEIKHAYNLVKLEQANKLKMYYYVYVELARVSFIIKRYQETVKICKEALMIKPNYIDFYYYLGYAHFNLKEYDEGIIALKKYFSLIQNYQDSLDEITSVELYTVNTRSKNLTALRLSQHLYNEGFYSESLTYAKIIDDKDLQNELFIKNLLKQKEFEKVVKLYNEVIDNNKFYFINKVEEEKKSLGEEDKKLLEVKFSEIQDSYGKLNLIRATKENRKKLILDFMNTEDVMEFSEQIILEYINYLIESSYLNRFFKKIDSLTIKKIVKVLIDKEDKMDYFMNILHNDFRFNDYQNNRIYLAIANVIMLSKIENRESTSEHIGKIFLEYINRGINYIKYVYNINHIRINYNTIINKEEKFLVLMYLAYEYADKGDYRLFFKYVNEATNNYPYLSKLIPEVLKKVYIKKAQNFVDSGEFLQAVETYEDIININVSGKEECISTIKYLEKKYRAQILEQLSNASVNKKIKGNYLFENVHLMIDSPYSENFIRFVNKHYNNSHHKFILVTNDGKCKFIKKNDKNLQLFSFKDKNTIIEILKNSNKIFVHFLLDYFCELISLPEIEGDIYWSIWGSDLYSTIDYQLYGTNTNEFLLSNSIPHISESVSFSVIRRRAIRKLNVILTNLPYEFDLVNKNFLTVARHERFIYPTLISNLYKNDQYKEKSCKKNKDHYTFLIGNSGDPSNNHFEVFNLLKKFSHHSKFKLIVPLSYGEPKYIEKLIEKGKEMFGDNFIPLTDFLPEQSYIEVLNEVDVAIMNHYRQQALGNIIVLLSLGKKIYLNDKSPVFQMLNERDFNIFEINKLENIQFNDLVKYNFDYKHNREKIIKEHIDSNIIKFNLEILFK
nr:TDP-N-acetylfucosamine:lipid II N-acetylfucosaminyltransferase [Lysinibacillus timonensis]